jgi:flagellar biosynthetic protein FlhB
MAEEDSSQEKTEEPTTKKLEKAREDGQVARSKELNTLVVLLAGSLSILTFGAMFYQGGVDVFSYNLMLERDDIFDVTRMGAHVYKSAIQALLVLLPFFGVMLLAAFLGPVALGGWLISPTVLAPKLSRMSPLKGIGRMFSKNSLMELLKGIAKVLLVSSVAILVLHLSTPGIQMLGRQSVDAAIPAAALIIVLAFLFMSLSMIIIAAVDVPFQIVEHTEKLKMTVQEIKDEMKNSEGKPEVKSRIRQLQQEMSRGRMMSAVPDADVIITNPTHFAVALKYDPVNMSSPIVVARGVDNVAEMIRELGKTHKVPLISYPILARAVYYSTELEQPIPEGLYLAVAQVLAYVFQLKQYYKGAGKLPTRPSNLKIPDAYVRMANQFKDRS